MDAKNLLDLLIEENAYVHWHTCAEDCECVGKLALLRQGWQAVYGVSWREAEACVRNRLAAAANGS